MHLDESCGEAAASMKSDICDREEYGPEETGSSSRNHVSAPSFAINVINSLAISVINTSVPSRGIKRINHRYLYASMHIPINRERSKWPHVMASVRNNTTSKCIYMKSKKMQISTLNSFFRQNLPSIILSYIKERNIYYFIDDTIFYREIISIETYSAYYILIKDVIK